MRLLRLFFLGRAFTSFLRSQFYMRFFLSQVRYRCALLRGLRRTHSAPRSAVASLTRSTPLHRHIHHKHSALRGLTRAPVALLCVYTRPVSVSVCASLLLASLCEGVVPFPFRRGGRRRAPRPHTRQLHQLRPTAPGLYLAIPACCGSRFVVV
jgi:hypothetical protein